MATEGVLQKLVSDMTVAELARLTGLELEQLVQLGLGAGRKQPAAKPQRPARQNATPKPAGDAPCTVSPEEIVGRLQRIADLSPKQTEVAHMLLLGESDRAIAARLGCSERTAKRQVADVLGRCGAGNRSSLMRVIFRDAGTLRD